MKPLSVVLEHLRVRYEPKLDAELESLSLASLPKVIFTALNGNDLIDNPTMSLHVLKKGHVPLNPMVLFDTYLVADHYKSKYEVILLCWRLTEAVDDFCVMNTKEITGLVPHQHLDFG